MTKKESALKFFLCATCACALVFSLLKPGEAAEAVFAALSLCARRVVPGVFLFMVGAKMFAKCGVAVAFSRITHGLFEKLFGLSRGGAAAVFLGLLSGYPSGAMVAGELIKKGELSRAEAERILPFATAASPAFLLASVGSMCGGARFGAVMLAAQLSAAFLLLFLSRKKGRTIMEKAEKSAEIRPVAAFTSAVKECGAASLNICSFVTFFYVFSAMLFSLLPAAWTRGFFGALLSGALEISCGFSRLGMLPNGGKRYFCGGLMLGFAGVSVLLQSADAVGDTGVSMKKYLLGKCAQAFCTSLFAALYGAFFSLEKWRSAFVFFGTEHATVAAVWEICLLFLVFCSFIVLLLAFFIKFFGLFKKIFKKLWKKSNP